MPFVNIKLIEGGLSHDERQELIKRVTDAVVSVYGEGVRSVTWVACEDVRSGEWGIAGQPITTADVKALRSQKAKEPVSA